MTPDAAADELYAADPAAFVARRDELARAARSGGDRASAAAIKALRRPTLGAWYVNVAARAGLVSLREWLRLGERLRAAQAAGDFTAVRAAGAERGGLEARVLRDLTAHLASRGTTASPAGLEEVRSTLHAALADPAASDAVRAGRLARPLEYAGFGEVDMAAALAAMGARPAVAAEPEARQAGEVAPAEEAERAERERAEQAGRAARERDRLERELSSARAKLSDAEAGARASGARVEQARRALEQAERAAATASGRVALLAETVADLEARLS